MRPRVLLAALNSRRLHVNPALFALERAAAAQGWGDMVEQLQFSLTSPQAEICGQILARRPQVLAFSTYIWNVRLLGELLPQLRLLLPRTLIFLGGPEVSARPEYYLHKLPVDAICMGEGEDSFARFLSGLAAGEARPSPPGWMYKGREQDYVPAPPPDLAALPFLYTDEELERLGREGRIVYYEASRGCPYGCAFCCSAREPLRLRPLATVLEELGRLAAAATQIKLVDRTFNADTARALAISQRCLELYRPGLSWHFEISPLHLPPELLELWLSAPPDYFRLELGVQSLEPEVLQSVGRRDVWSQALPGVERLIRGRAHLHLDLIAGLPQDTPEGFARSFHRLHQLGADYLQLGFLKLLPGTPLARRAGELGLLASPLPPYAVLSTPHMSAEYLFGLHQAEHAFNALYNKSEFREELIEKAEGERGGALNLYFRAAKIMRDFQPKDKHKIVELL